MFRIFSIPGSLQEAHSVLSTENVEGIGRAGSPGVNWECRIGKGFPDFKLHDHFNKCRKSIDKTQYPFMIKKKTNFKKPSTNQIWKTVP